MIQYCFKKKAKQLRNDFKPTKRKSGMSQPYITIFTTYRNSITQRTSPTWWKSSVMGCPGRAKKKQNNIRMCVQNWCVVCLSWRTRVSNFQETRIGNQRNYLPERAASPSLEFPKPLRTISFYINSSCRPLPSSVKCWREIGKSLQRKEKACNVQNFECLKVFTWIWNIISKENIKKMASASNTFVRKLFSNLYQQSTAK